MPLTAVSKPAKPLLEAVSFVSSAMISGMRCWKISLACPDHSLVSLSPLSFSLGARTHLEQNLAPLRQRHLAPLWSGPLRRRACRLCLLDRGAADGGDGRAGRLDAVDVERVRGAHGLVVDDEREGRLLVEGCGHGGEREKVVVRRKVGRRGTRDAQGLGRGGGGGAGQPNDQDAAATTSSSVARSDPAAETTRLVCALALVCLSAVQAQLQLQCRKPPSQRSRVRGMRMQRQRGRCSVRWPKRPPQRMTPTKPPAAIAGAGLPSMLPRPARTFGTRCPSSDLGDFTR